MGHVRHSVETYRLDALEALSDGGELNRRIIEAVPGGVVVVGSDGGMLRANAEALRILGLKYDELASRYIVDFDTETIWEDGSPCPMDAYPVTKALRTGESQPQATIGVRRRDGTIAWAVFRAVPVRGANGQITGAVATFIDITERKQAEEALRASEEKWRGLAQNIPDFVMTVDRDGFIQFINRTLPDVERDQVIGAHITSYVAPQYAKTLINHLGRVFEHGEARQFEVQGLGVDGKTVWYEDHLGPIMQDGKAIAAVLIARDITERVELVKQLAQSERMASVGVLAAGVAHEINNPLAYVLMNLGHALDRWPKEAVPSTRQALLEAREGALRVRDIVRGLKTFSRDDSGSENLVDVREVLDSAIQIAQNEIRNHAELTREYRDVPLVRASAARLGQVFLNLLVNAAHAVAPGARGEIVLSTRSVPERGEILIEVKDNGTGIAPDDLAKIFDPFFTTKPVGHGTGLGLSICYNLVAEAGGRIEVDSAVGRGTTVSVRIPVASGSRAGLYAADAKPDVATAGEKRVLIVDDDPLVARSLERLLATAHDVSIATSAADGLRLLGVGTYDVILCDVMMPGKSGLDLHAEIARSRPLLADKFVFITGGAASAEMQDRLALTGRPCILKPFEIREILDLVERARGD